MRGFSRTWFAISLACALGIALMSACGGDDDDDAEPELPPGWSVDPFDGEADVGLSRRVVVGSTIDPMDRETFTMKLLDAKGEVDGEGFFSRAQDPFEGDYYYFFPAELLAEDAQYAVELVIDGQTYHTYFATVQEAGEIPIYGNSEAGKLDPYAFEMTFPTAIEPRGFNDIIQIVLTFWNYMAAPSIIESMDNEVGEVTLAIGAGENFDGDEYFEQDHSSTGYLLEGEMNGPYLKIHGPLTINIPGYNITVAFTDVSAEFGETKAGEPMLEMGYISAYIDDCSVIKNFLPSQFGWIVDQICENNTLFIQLEIDLTYNPLDAMTFDAPSFTESYVSSTFTPGAWRETGYLINPLTTVFRVYDDEGELVYDSLEHLDDISYPTLDGSDASGTRFTAARFDFPSSLISGSYSVDFFLGMYCTRWSGLIVPGE